MKQHAFEHGGPCINLRTVTLFESIDPLGIGEYTEWQTEKQIFDALGFRAQAKVLLGDEVLTEGPELHDYGSGFGNCLSEAIEGATCYQEKLGERVDIIALATLFSFPAVRSKKEAFYDGHLNIFKALPRWGVSWKGGEYNKVVDLEEQKTEFTIWKNGSYTKEWEDVRALIKEYTSRDVAADWRRNRNRRS